MTREELIQYVKAVEDIKKFICLPDKVKEKYQVIDHFRSQYPLLSMGHHEIPNLIRRDFNAKGPNEKSDQGSQLTSNTYKTLLKKYRIQHCVSYKGSCVDNVPIESWFSAFKTECIYLNGKFDRVIAIELISNYINYYNNERLQEQLKELTPYEYRILALAQGFYSCQNSVTSCSLIVH